MISGFLDGDGYALEDRPYPSGSGYDIDVILGSYADDGFVGGVGVSVASILVAEEANGSAIVNLTGVQVLLDVTNVYGFALLDVLAYIDSPTLTLDVTPCGDVEITGSPFVGLPSEFNGGDFDFAELVIRRSSDQSLVGVYDSFDLDVPWLFPLGSLPTDELLEVSVTYFDVNANASLQSAWEQFEITVLFGTFQITSQFTNNIYGVLPEVQILTWSEPELFITPDPPDAAFTYSVFIDRTDGLGFVALVENQYNRSLNVDLSELAGRFVQIRVEAHMLVCTIEQTLSFEVAPPLEYNQVLCPPSFTPTEQNGVDVDVSEVTCQET